MIALVGPRVDPGAPGRRSDRLIVSQQRLPPDDDDRPGPNDGFGVNTFATSQRPGPPAGSGPGCRLAARPRRRRPGVPSRRPGYSDVGPSAWFENGARWVSAKAILGGINGALRPGRPVNRAQAATWMNLMFGGIGGTRTRSRTSPRRRVVPPGGGLRRLGAERRHRHGDRGPVRRPSDPDAEVQAVNWLYAAAGSPALTGLPRPGFGTSAPGSPAARWAKGHGIVSGFSDRTFRPNEPVTAGSVRPVAVPARSRAWCVGRGCRVAPADSAVPGARMTGTRTVPRRGRGCPAGGRRGRRHGWLGVQRAGCRGSGRQPRRGRGRHRIRYGRALHHVHGVVDLGPGRLAPGPASDPEVRAYAGDGGAVRHERRRLFGGRRAASPARHPTTGRTSGPPRRRGVRVLIGRRPAAPRCPTAPSKPGAGGVGPRPRSARSLRLSARTAPDGDHPAAVERWRQRRAWRRRSRGGPSGNGGNPGGTRREGLPRTRPNGRVLRPRPWRPRPPSRRAVPATGDQRHRGHAGRTKPSSVDGDEVASRTPLEEDSGGGTRTWIAFAALLGGFGLAGWRIRRIRARAG